MKAGAIFLIFVGVLNFSCSEHKTPSSSSISSNSQIVDSVFNDQFSAFSELIDDSLNLYGKPVPSAIFFEEITGIKPNTNASTFGLSFIDKKGDLEKWKNWYQENKSVLRWNEKEKRVYKIE